MGKKRGRGLQKGGSGGSGSLLLTPQLVSYLNEAKMTYAEATELYEQGKLSLPDLQSESVSQEQNVAAQHYAYSAFQISPDPLNLPMPNLA
mmetsp:Transcript_4257/g.6012  ORF Transcript_4257/g.6012 Transcript_4257/m.6012 type:complete len:91 (+) Transcript_4257:69-341(+)|eukprot:CAMPEP_0197331794 /NCGR_PEP_ID=MMETSP0892-20130614/12523_1 /TAXON_ID=44058 ORGANISM="Aureoumbra lagunensis, Strain CCMP1510" /NCGR_SAMPLE_ID=MMETSP0892 /ASSEMBLY_ACC=CAM_ASM_000538 /LENGTH=90 /DNA_ID=CAMNT_0042829891 /DNA_START=56 /DNA_END=328 /DNA_ORIENTATION=+